MRSEVALMIVTERTQKSGRLKAITQQYTVFPIYQSSHWPTPLLSFIVVYHTFCYTLHLSVKWTSGGVLQQPLAKAGLMIVRERSPRLRNTLLLLSFIVVYNTFQCCV